MLTRFLGIVKKEFSELIKDRLYLTFVFFCPLDSSFYAWLWIKL
jgi:hypothetical protein